MRRRPLHLGREDEEEMGRGAPLLVRCTREGGGIYSRRELRPAAPSTQASSAVRRESSDPSIGAGTQIHVAILYKNQKPRCKYAIKHRTFMWSEQDEQHERMERESESNGKQS
ncbi:uncharacterized protein [Triticum aestivum]|uniref:uncharacterized protein n=1 Tax=Triticum aestivum TaxID=4565 RepID=UPI001D02A05D|nr:uncharacterized protein LOC123182532 [Triticum aestivum]